ncbi:MAG TPA: alpha-glucuronidase family glycosyl hydrolase, partial [Pirellula sp.]|nr:alpha-glucuronidase family glycosyl hydrolase [Pirellula sp.]
MRVWRANLGLILCLPLVIGSASAAAPKVDLVISGEASSLEKHAASEIATVLKTIFEAQVTISSAAPDGAEHLIFVGRPESIPVTKEKVFKKWPNLKDQDHFLLTIKFKGKPALLVGGQSPRATYWASSEYAHSLGVRSMLFGDLYPVDPKPFSLDQYDRLLTLNSDSNTWLETDPFPTGITAWSLEESKQRIHQIARLKYFSIAFETHSSQPFVKDAKSDRREQSGDLWFGWRFPVSGDTAGRFAFRGAKFFLNPEFANAVTNEQRMQAGNKWVTGLAAQAESFGMMWQVKTKDQTL